MEQLKQLAAHFINNHTATDAQNLWHVITALRGPDIRGQFTCACGCKAVLYDHEMKYATTEVIRYHFYKSAELTPPNGHPEYFSMMGCDLGPDNPRCAELRLIMQHVISSPPRDPGISHFVRHAQKAFKALNLSWTEVNPK